MSWYKVIDINENVSQGDIFFDCPIYHIDADTIDFKNPFNFVKPKTKIYTADVVVLTQACDLEQQNGMIKTVVVVPLHDVTNAAKWGFVSEILAGRRPNYYLLNKFVSENLNMDYKIADFENLQVIPYEIPNRYREFHGKRLRLNTPHRELLSQRFGAYFTRIGLPNEDSIDKDDLKQICK